MTRSMEAYRASRPRRDILEDLRQGDQFADFLFLAWGIVEMMSSSAVLRAYGLSSRDTRADLLLNLSVGQKLACFKDTGYLTQKEYQTVKEFKDIRNDLFHESGIMLTHLTPSRKEKIMDCGMRAADVMHDLSARPFKQTFHDYPS
jgi:hypothetical protein